LNVFSFKEGIVGNALPYAYGKKKRTLAGEKVIITK
jgi:hypothetical protein